jgi:SAM-dependent methyltransferase
MRLPPILKALSIQLIAVLAMVLMVRIAGLRLPLWPAMFAVGMLAAIITKLVKFPRWWLPIQALFVPALALAMHLNLSAWVYLSAFLLLAVVYWSTYRSQVPLYLSSRLAWRALEDLLPQGRSFKFADVGAGLGGVQAHLARIRPDGLFVGFENAPLPFLIAWVRMLRHSNCTMRRADFWQMSFADYDIVYAYLSPVPMARLWEKANREMRTGTILVSNTFEVPGQSPDREIKLDDFHRSKLLVWTICG